MNKMKNFYAAITNILIAFALFAAPLHGELTEKEAILSGNIQFLPVENREGSAKIQPGTPVKMIVKVSNSGNFANPPAKLFVRYAFPKPLNQEKSSVLYLSETKELPKIEPGEQVEIAFETEHQTPSVIDFVRYDWPKREYQAVLISSGQEQVIATSMITFSAYYYPAVQSEGETRILIEN